MEKTEKTTQTKPEFIPLRNDILFHMVFTRNKAALKSLLSVLLALPEQEIREIEVLNPVQHSERIDTKQTVLDLKVHLNGDRFILVEMQVRRFQHWTNRILVYACRQVAEQVHDEFKYHALEPVIQISIMNYSLFRDHPRFFAKYLLRDEEGYLYSDRLQLYVMDLTQIENATEEQRVQGLTEWANVFHANSWEEMDRIENTGVKEAAKTMKFILADPTERDLLQWKMDALNDWNNMLYSEHEEGLQEGLQRGQIQTLAGLVRDGILTVSDAAQRAGLTEAEFISKAEELA